MPDAKDSHHEEPSNETQRTSEAPKCTDEDRKSLPVADPVIPPSADGGLPTPASEKSGPDGGLSAPADPEIGQEPPISKANSDDPDPKSEIRVYDNDGRNIRGLGKRRPLGRKRDSFWGVEANEYLLDDSDEFPGESSLELKRRFQEAAKAPPPWLTTEARTFGYHAPERIFGPRPKPAAPIPPRSGLMLTGQVEKQEPQAVPDGVQTAAAAKCKFTKKQKRSPTDDERMLGAEIATYDDDLKRISCFARGKRTFNESMARKQFFQLTIWEALDSSKVSEKRRKDVFSDPCQYFAKQNDRFAFIAEVKELVSCL